MIDAGRLIAPASAYSGAAWCLPGLRRTPPALVLPGASPGRAGAACAGARPRGHFCFPGPRRWTPRPVGTLSASALLDPLGTWAKRKKYEFTGHAPSLGTVALYQLVWGASALLLGGCTTFMLAMPHLGCLRCTSPAHDAWDLHYPGWAGPPGCWPVGHARPVLDGCHWLWAVHLGTAGAACLGCRRVCFRARAIRTADAWDMAATCCCSGSAAALT